MPFEDSLQVVQWLEEASIDLIEVSGGTYEQPKLVGLEGLEEEEPQEVAHSTRMREAYFIDFAVAMQEKVSIPLMVTGGFRRRDVMEHAIQSGGADVIGLGRPMCVDTDAPARLLAGEAELNRYEADLSLLPDCLAFLGKVPLVRAMAGFSVMYWFYAQLDSLARTGLPQPGLSVFAAALRVKRLEAELLKKQVRSTSALPA